MSRFVPVYYISIWQKQRSTISHCLSILSKAFYILKDSAYDYIYLFNGKVTPIK